MSERWLGTSIIECWDCGSTGDDPHGNTCIFCDGHGWLDEREDDRPLEDIDDDEFQTPLQEES